MTKLLNMALAAALGFAVSAPVYAVDTYRSSPAKQTTAMSDADFNAAMSKCSNLTGTDHAKCVVNIRPTPAGDKAATNSASSSDKNSVKDGTAASDAEYQAAVKECEGAKAADKDSCIKTADEQFGRL
jgi:hypothetical protein